MNTSDIGAKLILWLENEHSRREIERIQKTIEKEVIEFLKQRKWTKHVDQYSGLTINLITFSEDVIDKKQMRYILTSSQYSQIVKKMPVEKLFILTPEQIEHMRADIQKKTQHR